jgi:hypothetical protein
MDAEHASLRGLHGLIDERTLEHAKRSYDTDEQRTERMRAIEKLKDEIAELAGHLNAANYRLLKLIAELARSEGWSDGATRSCAHWLNWKCGINMGAAREKVRTARALEALPKIAAAMERGELSYSNARAITRVATPETEEMLLSIALHGTADHVEKTVRLFRRCLDAEELSREAQQQKNRSVRYHWDDDGSLVLKARLPAELGAMFLKAIDAAVDELHGKRDLAKELEAVERKDVSAETLDEKPTISMKRADAFGIVAEAFLKHGEATMNAGDRFQIVVHVDAETLRDGTPGRCEIEHGPSMAAETARRLACDSSVVRIGENNKGEPLNLGRKTRSIPPALRRALNARDCGCRFPGCTHKRYVDAHHIEHWAHGGETKMSNLVSLCRFHHRAVHEGAVRIEILDDGAVRFVRPDGRTFDSIAPGNSRPFDWTELRAAHHARGIQIDESTSCTRWRGERMDYGLALETF